MSDDSFVREVDEAVRHDEFRQLWDRYGIFALAGAALIVLAVAGYKGWHYWQAQQAASAGSRFVGALTLDEDGKGKDAAAAFKDLAANGPGGYRVLSRFQLAAAAAKKGDSAKAVEAYDALATDSSVHDILQGYAKIQAATLLIDKDDLAAMKTRIGALAEGSGPWRNSAREVLGLTAYRTGDKAEAERYFRRILVDPGVPANMRQRAQMMLALIVKADEAPAAGQ